MTRDEMFDVLRAAYTGGGSTDEGTFAGDILRACADGMAQLWSMEIDGMENRAFVSTATGDYLTAVCADRGVERREGEDDESLRRRTLDRLTRRSAGGNADDYALWCATVPGILRVRVLPRHRGNGTVDIVAVGQDGKAPAEETIADAQAVIDENRPVGADARVLPAVEQTVSVSAQVKLSADGNLEAVQTAFTSALQAFLRENALVSGVVSYIRASRLLLDCPGVEDVTAFTLNGQAASIALDETTVAVMGNVSVSEVTT